MSIKTLHGRSRVAGAAAGCSEACPMEAWADSQTEGCLHVLELARGGMGTVEVVLKEDRGVDRLYARKRLLPSLCNDEIFLKMFLDEARIAGSIHHPNVVSVLHCGKDSDGPFLLMDLVQGLSLFELLKASSRTTILPLSFILELGLRCALGLEAAHTASDNEGRPLGLVHRDLSPQNILLSWQGEVRITDFGIAKADGRESQTSTGLLKGKWGYMSPEQLSFRPVDHRSDLFSLGIVLFETITGRRLYGGNGGVKAARRILNEEPLDPRAYRLDCPEPLAELVVSLLQKEPTSRPQSAAIVAERFHAMRATYHCGDGAVRRFLARNLHDRREAADRFLSRAIEETRLQQRPRSRRARMALASLSIPDLDGQADMDTQAESRSLWGSALTKPSRSAWTGWAVSLVVAFTVGQAVSWSTSGEESLVEQGPGLAEQTPESLLRKRPMSSGGAWQERRVSALEEESVDAAGARSPMRRGHSPAEPESDGETLDHDGGNEVGELDTVSHQRSAWEQNPYESERAVRVADGANQSEGSARTRPMPVRGARPQAVTPPEAVPAEAVARRAVVAELELWEWEP